MCTLIKRAGTLVIICIIYIIKLDKGCSSFGELLRDILQGYFFLVIFNSSFSAGQAGGGSNLFLFVHVAEKFSRYSKHSPSHSGSRKMFQSQLNCAHKVKHFISTSYSLLSPVCAFQVLIFMYYIQEIKSWKPRRFTTCSTVLKSFPK